MIESQSKEGGGSGADIQGPAGETNAQSGRMYDGRGWPWPQSLAPSENGLCLL